MAGGVGRRPLQIYPPLDHFARLPAVPRCALRKRPVCDVLHAATSSGVPVTTTSPPAQRMAARTDWSSWIR
jgi:hypothetical protein